MNVLNLVIVGGYDFDSLMHFHKSTQC